MADRWDDRIFPDNSDGDRIPVDRVRLRYAQDGGEPFWSGTDDAQPDRSSLQPGSGEPPPSRRTKLWRWLVRGFAVFIVLLIIAIGWLAVTAPLSQSLEPLTPPSITLTAADGSPIARRGAIIGKPVDAATLPPHVRDAFVAIEDRRFYSHWGIDPRGIIRAAVHNFGSGGVREGGSTITQQLAKNAFLDSDRTFARKIREILIAFWLEAWLSKDQILSRYLSNVYFGDNSYGLSAAAKHYFGRTPDKLNIGQAAMLAGLVKAPSRLAPTGNLKGAQAREAVVVGAMEDAGFLTRREARAIRPQRVLSDRAQQLPIGTYFADWVLPQARDQVDDARTNTTVQTTLDPKLQKTAERVIRQAGLRQAQVALVAMRRDGEVVAMVGGRDYAKSPFNRAVQARRQPGSTFKLFVYLAALRDGKTPSSTVDDSPVDIAGWKPRNDDGRYLGEISLARAFARSSNVAAARLTQEVGVRSVIKAARDLGITTPIANEATIGLGTSGVSLLELTAAYAGIANGTYPVAAHGLAARADDRPWYSRIAGGPKTLPERVRRDMLSLLSSSIRGTGRAAVLSVPAYGKTGTSQDSRDAWFVGFAGDLVVGVWIGNDDNSPYAGLHGGGIPAQIWHAFMQSALDLSPPPPPPSSEDVILPDDPVPQGDPVGALIDQAVPGALDAAADRLRDAGIELRRGADGSISIDPVRSRRAPPPLSPPPVLPPSRPSGVPPAPDPG